jgi:hypothetical protein
MKSPAPPIPSLRATLSPSCVRNLTNNGWWLTGRKGTRTPLSPSDAVGLLGGKAGAHPKGRAEDRGLNFYNRNARDFGDAV